jgi:hypothetical protein
MSQSIVEMADYDDGNVLDTVCIQIVVQASSKGDRSCDGQHASLMMMTGRRKREKDSLHTSHTCERKFELFSFFLGYGFQ